MTKRQISGKKFTCTKRQRDCLMGNTFSPEERIEKLREGLKILKKNPQKFHNVPKEEGKRIVATFSKLIPEDLDLIAEIAAKHSPNSYPEVVQNALDILIEKYNWSPPAIGPMTGAIKRYVASTRLRDALEHHTANKSHKLKLIREGLSILQQHPEKIKVEGIGEKEQSTTVTLDLTEKDLQVIDSLLNSVEGLHSNSVIIRNVIEILIEKYNWKKYKKPEDWIEIPLPAAVISHGVNPNAKMSLKEKTSVSISAPPIINEYLRSLTKTDRTERYLKTSYTMSDFSRDAIDNCNWSKLQPLSATEKFGKGNIIVTNVYVEQRKKVEEFLENNPQFHNMTDVWLAIYLQEIRRQGSKQEAS